MPRLSRAQPGFWVICRGSSDEPLAVSVPETGEALAVFSFEEEADLYLMLSGAKENVSQHDLQTWPVSPNAMLELLLSPGSNLEWVVLDPMPERGAGPMLRLACMRRDDFVGFLSKHAAVPVGPGG